MQVTVGISNVKESVDDILAVNACFEVCRSHVNRVVVQEEEVSVAMEERWKSDGAQLNDVDKFLSVFHAFQR